MCLYAEETVCIPCNGFFVFILSIQLFLKIAHKKTPHRRDKEFLKFRNQFYSKDKIDFSMRETASINCSSVITKGGAKRII